MESDRHRTIGVLRATGVGVGAIVGGGILVLAGVAFAATGPSAVVAFALNGGIAFITAMSFAELATSFPESGGAYSFAKKVLSVRAAFAVGWVLWFAYIMAGVLYALGFATYAGVALAQIWGSLSVAAPAWIGGRELTLLLGSGAAVMYAGTLIRRASGGGQLATVGKLVVFAVLIAAGAIALFRQPLAVTRETMTPLLPGGTAGLLAAMGFTFIALQGFDLVAAIAGEVREPARTIPRAMFFSLGLALVVYLPLLVLVAGAGFEAGDGVRSAALRDPDTVMAVAAQRFMGPVGYWLVVVAAVLSTLSALHACILAASRVALAMARDRTLPDVLGNVHPHRRTPVLAIYASTLALVAFLFMVPDLASAGAAASLIFLLSFTLAHLTAILARRRGGSENVGFRTPFFPLVPVVGLVACALLAAFQSVVSPAAAGIVVVWLAFGGILYFALFAGRAETFDAGAEGLDPGLSRLRGKTPVVLLPIANPARAAALVQVANALAPRSSGRVLLLTIVPLPDEADREEFQRQLGFAQQVIGGALGTSFESGHSPEAMISAASAPWAEIARVARAHRCESILLGLGPLMQAPTERQLRRLVDQVDCHVALMRAPDDWRLEGAERVLVPLGGRGDQHGLRARLLNSLHRTGTREFTFLRVMRSGASDAELSAARRQLARLASDLLPGSHTLEVVRSAEPVGEILGRTERHQLVVLGLSTRRLRRDLLNETARRISTETRSATILLSRGR